MPDINSQWHYPGARWWKFDFHTHTPASDDYGKGRTQASLKRTTSKDWLLGFMRAGVDCVAVTDHNSGEWIDKLQAALVELKQELHSDFRPLHLFPGVEITASGGVHILALLDVDKTSADVERLLGAVDYRGGGERVTWLQRPHPSRWWRQPLLPVGSRFRRTWISRRLAHGSYLEIRWRRCSTPTSCSPWKYSMPVRKNLNCIANAT